MNNSEKERFVILLRGKFNNELKVLNDTLEKYLEIVEKKKEANKNAYRRNKDKDEFKQKKEGL